MAEKKDETAGGGKMDEAAEGDRQQDEAAKDDTKDETVESDRNDETAEGDTKKDETDESDKKDETAENDKDCVGAALGAGLTPALTCGTVAFKPPVGAAVGALYAVEVPGTNGQSILVKIPRQLREDEQLLVTYEISKNGVLQHSFAECSGRPKSKQPVDPVEVVEIASPPNEGLPLCKRLCCLEVFVVFILTVALGATPALLLADEGNVALSTFGLVLSSILPTAVLGAYMYIKFRKSLFKMQMMISFGEAIIWMVPLAVIFVGIKAAAGMDWCTCREVCEHGKCRRICDKTVECYARDALFAFIFAALFEETLKFLCVRRITFASLVVDAQSLFVYGGCSALGFATVENLLYVLKGGVQVAASRAILSVPLHTGLGLMMGGELGLRRFLDQPVRCLPVLFWPVIVHGVYDVALFFAIRTGLSAIIGLLIAAIMLVACWLRVRVLVMRLTVVPQCDVHELLRRRAIDRPRLRCCMCCWAPAREAAPVQVWTKDTE